MAQAYRARRAEPGWRMTYHDQIEGEIELVADRTGAVRIRTEGQQRAADSVGLEAADAAPAKSAPDTGEG